MGKPVNSMIHFHRSWIDYLKKGYFYLFLEKWIFSRASLDDDKYFTYEIFSLDHIVIIYSVPK